MCISQSSLHNFQWNSDPFEEARKDVEKARNHNGRQAEKQLSQC